MTLPASGAISFEQIRDEFGGTDPISIEDYYRGGGLVPDTAANANIPTSGAIVVPDDFWGAEGARVDVIGGSVVVVAPAGSQNAAYQLNSNGTEREGEGGVFATTNTWRLSGVSGDYQCRMTMVSGTTFSGASTGVWLACSTTRTWELNDSAPGLPSVQGEGTIEIRDASTLDVLDSATVNLSSRQTV